MATKTIAWESGGGYITITYTGTGNGPVSVQSDANKMFEERQQIVQFVTTEGSPEKAVSLLVKQEGKTYPVGTVFNFGYTGTVQEITLPRGKYKLQCWGAQGGSVSGSYTAAGSKGGYSEGVLTITEPTIIYVFVGGQGTSSSTSSTSGTANGGWNGGGASVRYSSYNSGNTYGVSYPRPGGGSTDMCLVTSTMNYSSGRTNRSSASLLSRFIVAGGGAGASARYTEETIETEFEVNKEAIVYNGHPTFTQNGTNYFSVTWFTTSAGSYYTIEITGTYYNYTCSGFTEGEIVSTSGSANVQIGCRAAEGDGSDVVLKITRHYKSTETETSTSTSSGQSNSSQQGGGTNGCGQYPGTQNSAGSGGEFGLGGNQSTTNYRYDAGAGGGGWYGGGTSHSDTGTGYVNYSGGGSGFVNTAANAGYRPSGYTGLQLDSGSTQDGSTSFASPSGGNETGHSGDGYARITVIE